MKPVFIMMVGLPASGKSTYSAKLKDAYHAVVLSSDDLRAVFGESKNDQSVTVEVFAYMQRESIARLNNGVSVIYDATNISAYRRIEMLKKLADVDCRKICVEVRRSYEACRASLAGRDHDVPEYALKKMAEQYEAPSYEEGWDEIKVINVDEVLK